ncbi:helix-turn-helix transcriptional regulator [Streptomyces sp. NPDC004959]|uniref:helix-turn-helix domain-containing protein n=1 Tax=unclassified Streptomyces TaxID=2593676 RepID=UPI0004CBF3C0|nr:helix-turn-helix transcriptional regulator [Streptomyces sp. NRRL F-5630]
MAISPGDPLRLLTWQYFGEELRRLREGSGLTQAELAALVYVSASYIAQFEAGRRKPKADVADRLDEVLKTGGTFSRFVQKLITNQPVFAPHVMSFLDLEQEAEGAYVYESNRIPGILQTRRYAEALFHAYRPYATNDDEEIADLTERRMERGDLLGPPHHLRLWAVLQETALRVPVGGAEAMHEQLLHLIDQIHSKRAVIQVLPISVGATSVMLDSFTILRFRDLPPVLHTEALCNGITRDEGEVLEEAFEVYAQLRSAALSPDASLEYIESLTQGSPDSARQRE